MFNTMENFSVCNILSGIASLHRYYPNRPYHGLVFKPDGKSRYTFDKSIFDLSEGDVLYIPCGTDYEVQQLSEGEGHYIVINFSADIENPLPRLYSLQNRMDTEHLFSALSRHWLLGNTADKYKCLSMIYNLLSQITETDRGEYAMKKKLSMITPAVEYLKAHIFDPNLRISDLPALCGLSDTYFRRIFKDEFTVAPHEYVTNKRCIQARALLLSGDFNTVSQVAREVGFADPLYFSRVFHKKYGVSPSEFSLPQ